MTVSFFSFKAMVVSSISTRRNELYSFACIYHFRSNARQCVLHEATPCKIHCLAFERKWYMQDEAVRNLQ